MRINKLAHQIYESGVKHVFGIPGSGFTLSLIDELEKFGVEFILNHFEGSSALMAGTYGMLSNNVGISLSIKGPGLTNSIPGIAASHFESFPLVHISEAHSYNSPLSSAHKRLNQTNLINEVSKGCVDLSINGEGFLQCSNLAKSETPGPVLLQLVEEPLDITFNKLLVDKFDLFSSEVNREIINSKNTVIIIGSLGVRKHIKDKLDNLKIPVFSTASAKGVFDEFSDYSAGVYTGVGLSLTPEYELIRQADLIVCFGLTAREVLSCKPFPCKSINIECSITKGVEGFKFNYNLDWRYHDEVIELLLHKHQDVNKLNKIKSTLDQKLCSDFLPGYVFNYLNQYNSVRKVLDTGYFCTIGEHSLKTNSINGCILSGQSRYMGTCIPMALASLIYDPLTPVIAFVGDGGIGMYISELKIAFEKKLPLLIILMSDGTLGSIRTKSIKSSLTQKPLIINQSSWVKVINALGFNTAVANNETEFDKFFKNYSFGSGPAFLELNFNQDKYQEMVVNIR